MRSSEGKSCALANHAFDSDRIARETGIRAVGEGLRLKMIGDD